jgi:tight adherence protein C
MRILHKMGTLMIPKKDKEKQNIRRKLCRAGYRFESVLSVFYGLRVFSALMTGLCLLLLSRELNTRTLVLCYGGLLIGYNIPFWILQWKEKQRVQSIFRELPDALDMVIVCMNAGFNFDRALYRVSQELNLIAPVLSKEFERYFYEVESGYPVHDALQNLINRNEVEELTSIIQVLIQSSRFGTDIIQALRIHAEGLRTKRRQMAEEKAAKVSVKLVFPTILFIMPAMMLIILGPTGIRLIERIKDVQW